MLPLAAAALLWLATLDVETLFGLSAETEAISGTLAPREASELDRLTWNLDGAVLCAGPEQVRPPGFDATASAAGACGLLRQVSESFSGSLRILEPADFQMERLSAGPLRVLLRGAPGQEIAGIDSRAPAGPAAVVLTSPVSIVISDVGRLARQGRPVRLPIVARSVRLGKPVELDTIAARPMVRQGSIRTLGRRLVVGELFVAGSMSLELGDYVIVPEPRGYFAGTVSADERPALQAVYQVEAGSAVIRRFQSQDLKVSLSWLTRLMNDPVPGMLLLLGWSLIGLGVQIYEVWPRSK